VHRNGRLGDLPAGRGKEMGSIAGIAYHLGELRPIDEVDFLRADAKRLELYKLAGFEQYAASNLSMRELAHRSAIQTLDECGIDRDDIGYCLYVAESFDRDELVNSTEVNRLLVELGLENAVPIHISVSNCANIMSAVRVATALIESSAARHVLIASVDKASRRFAGRKMFQEMSVKSDVSVSCLVSGHDEGQYAILYLGQHNAAGMVEMECVDSASYSVPKFKSIRGAAKHARETLDLTAADFARIITNNYSQQVTKMFIELCGFPREAGCYTNISRFAHAVAGDVLINLKDLETAGALNPGDRMFLMADSVTSSSVLCLQKR